MPDDVLAARARRRAAPPPEVAAVPDLLVEERTSGFGGWVVGIEGRLVALRNDLDEVRRFPIDGAFAVDGRLVRLVRPRTEPAEPRVRRTAAGAIAGPSAAPRVARASRIWVEGVHDAALLERVWGEELAEAAVVVEPLGGIDHLADHVRTFRPGPGRLLGVLVDHLVAGSKESRIVAGLTGEHVLVTGHPWVDVWQGVRPSALGIRGWPSVPRDRAWKEGVCTALGWGSPQDGWRRVLAAVDSHADLETTLIGAVERLLDHVLE